MYNIDYFISKFEAIPNKQWTIGSFEYHKSSGEVSHCALGHCGVRGWSQFTEEAFALQAIFHNIGFVPHLVNDNAFDKEEYLGKTPKERILNVLYKIKKEEQEKQQEKQELDNAVNLVNDLIKERKQELVN